MVRLRLRILTVGIVAQVVLVVMKLLVGGHGWRQCAYKGSIFERRLTWRGLVLRRRRVMPVSATVPAAGWRSVTVATSDPTSAPASF